MSAPKPKLSRPGFGALFVLVALDLLGFGMVVPLLPLYAQRFVLTGAQIGWLLACYSLMQLLFAPVWGSLSDRIGRRSVLLFSLVGQIFALVGLALSHSFLQLFLSRSLAGLFAANLVVAHAYIADVSEPEERPRRMGLLGAAFGLGFVGGPALAGELSVLGAALPAWCAASLALINVSMAWRWLPESLPQRASREATMRLGQSLMTAWQERIRALWGLPGLYAPLLLVFGHILGFAAMELSLTLFVAQTFGFDARESGRLLAYVGLVLIVVQGGLIGPLSRRLGAYRLVRLGLFFMAFGMALLAQSGTVGFFALFVSLALLAIGQGFVTPSLSAIVATHSGQGRYGLGLGLSQSASALARVLGPLGAGCAIDRGGSALALHLGAMWLFVLALVTTLPRVLSTSQNKIRAPKALPITSQTETTKGAVRDAI